MVDPAPAASTTSADPKPDVKPQATPEAKPEAAKPETKPDVQPDGKAEEPAGQKPAKETAKPDEQKPEGGEKPPATYDLKVPEGSLLTKDDVEQVAKIAKEQGFSQAKAQGLLEERHQAIKQYDDRQMATLSEQQKQWKSQAETDPEYGGGEFRQNAELAHRVVEKYGTPAFKAALNRSGLGDHPEMLRVFWRIGQAMNEDQLIMGTPAEQTKEGKSLADRLYPTTAGK